MDNQKPKTTWQSYDPKTNILTVHVSDDPNSPIYFQGSPDEYDGSAVEPPAPTYEYLRKQHLASEEDNAEKEDEAASEPEPEKMEEVE